VPEHRSLGPPLRLTQPLKHHTTAAGAPWLAAGEGFKEVPALREQSLDRGQDILLTAKLMAAFRSPAEVALDHFRLHRAKAQMRGNSLDKLMNYGLGDAVEDYARAQLASADRVSRQPGRLPDGS
jgi:hypothetical protein